MKNSIANKQIVAREEGLFSKLRLAQQRMLAEAFAEFAQSGDPHETVLEVGHAASGTHSNVGSLADYADSQLRRRVHTCRIPFLHGHDNEKIAADRQQSGDGIRLPYLNAEFDWIYCSGVIEHAGGWDRQFELVQELMRIARKGVFITTQNRRHPVDFHAALPFTHWLPDAWRRRALGWAGRSAEASVPRPNLLHADSLYRFAGMLPDKFEHDVGHKRAFGIKAQFFLMIKRNPAAA